MSMTREEIDEFVKKWLAGQRYTTGEITVLAKGLLTCPPERADGVMHGIMASRECVGRVPVAVILRRVRAFDEAQRTKDVEDKPSAWHTTCPVDFREAATAFEMGQADTLVDSGGQAFRILCVTAAPYGAMRWAFRCREVGANSAKDVTIWQDQMSGYTPMKAGQNEEAIL